MEIFTMKYLLSCKFDLDTAVYLKTVTEYRSLD